MKLVNGVELMKILRNFNQICTACRDQAWAFEYANHVQNEQVLLVVLIISTQ